MKRLDKYLIVEFLLSLSGSLLFLTGIFIIFVCIDNLKYFSNPNVPFKFIVYYILNLIPGTVVQILPAAVLFSVTFIFGKLNISNEIIALYNGKIGFTRLIIPLVIIGMFLSLFSFFFFEFVSVDCGYRAHEIRNNIKILTGKKLNYMYARRDFFYRGKDNTFYYIELSDPAINTLIKPVLFRFDNRGFLSFQLYARIAHYEEAEKNWIFRQARILSFDNRKNFNEEYADSYSMKLDESPKSFVETSVSYSQRSLADTIKLIKIKKKIGANYKKYLVEMHWRFAFPFSIIIVILIGSMAGIYFRKAVLVLAFFISIIISFGYYGLLAVGLAFGKAGKIDPMLAAWLANIVYFTASLIAVRIKR
ncbi:MAG: LptF/LptG family permease [Spirochaetota bacterium]|nr:LptF/LptG family permease [Spirochaetota bacterium]